VRADALRTSFAALRLELDGQPVRLTLSAGVAVYPEHGDNVATLLQAADEALYAAKNGGRDQVHAASVACSRNPEGPVSEGAAA
jgi:diguanylate cyclase (GGDEF)-like protein